MYRQTFGRVKSTFRNVLASPERVALEWVTQGTNRKGEPLRYEGVTVLELANDRITRSMAYFDPSTLGRQVGTIGASIPSAAKRR
jgi:ketosteroid isomerase-like protein